MTLWVVRSNETTTPRPSFFLGSDRRQVDKIRRRIDQYPAWLRCGHDPIGFSVSLCVYYAHVVRIGIGDINFVAVWAHRQPERLFSNGNELYADAFFACLPRSRYFRTDY